MTSSVKLGGFKVLRDVVWISFVSTTPENHFPMDFCRTVAGGKINLPHLTCLRDTRFWGVNVVVDRRREKRLLSLFDGNSNTGVLHRCESVVLSIFPHRGDPRIAGLFLNALTRGGMRTESLASSPSAVSAVLENQFLEGAGHALFGPFYFNAYRTPEDWKLAQKGKESLYKDVVASYQESRPKVYGLRYRENQEMLRFTLSGDRDARLGHILRCVSGYYLTFLGTSPARQGGDGENVVLCLPRSRGTPPGRLIQESFPTLRMETFFPVASFSMTGPHFGDRYGISSDLLSALDGRGVHPLALTCSIASVRGLVPQGQLEESLEAIRSCFDVPALIKRE